MAAGVMFPDCDGRGYLDPSRETGPFYIHVQRGGLPEVTPRQEGRRLYLDEFSWQEDPRSSYDEVNARMRPDLDRALEETGEADVQISPAQALLAGT